MQRRHRESFWDGQDGVESSSVAHLGVACWLGRDSVCKGGARSWAVVVGAGLVLQMRQVWKLPFGWGEIVAAREAYESVVKWSGGDESASVAMLGVACWLRFGVQKWRAERGCGGRGVVRYANAAFLRLSLENCGLPLGGSRVYLSRCTQEAVFAVAICVNGDSSVAQCVSFYADGQMDSWTDGTDGWVCGIWCALVF